MVEFVSINGAQLAYRLIGPENAPLIITLHGGRGFGEPPWHPPLNVYGSLISCFTTVTGDHKSDFKAYSPLSSSYRVLSFDFRGHGQSSRTEPFTFHQLVEDIEGIRQHFLGPDQPCIVCGGSFGGFLAQQYAITHPARVSHLILRGTAPSHHRKCHLGVDLLGLLAWVSKINMIFILTEPRRRNGYSDPGTKSI